jgi:glycosyltransferase involved in cell wall biosynthesis
MKTAHTTLALSRLAGGMQASVADLCRTLLSEQRVETRVYGPMDRFCREDLPKWAPVDARPLPTYFRRWAYMPSLRHELDEFSPDLLHCHGLWVYHSPLTMWWAQEHRRPYIISAHGMLDEVELQKGRIQKAIATLLYEGAHVHNAACLRALCEPERDSMRNWGYRGPICVIPNGINPASSNGQAEPPWSGKVRPGMKVMLYLGRIHPKKGLRQLLDAMAIVKRDLPDRVQDWCLAIIGWDQEGFEDELRRQAEALELGAHVLFLGSHFGAAKAAAYEACDAFVLPSTSEGVPNVVLEAWTHSKAVLMTPQCNIPEGFALNAAVKADPTANSLAEGLRSLFAMSDREREAMGRRGLALVGQKFSWSDVAAKMRQVFDWILGGGSPPSCVEKD